MSSLTPLSAGTRELSALVATAGARAQTRFFEFFAAQIRNKHTRRAYAQAMREFLAWCESAGVASIAHVKPLHVAAYIEQLGRDRSAPTVKQRLAAIRHLFDWLVTGQIMSVNPASSVRGPSHSVKRGKTPVLDPSEARALLDAIDVSTPVGLRDRALIGLMVYSFARIGAALGMKSRRRLRAKPKFMGLLARKGRQAPRNALPPQPRDLPPRLRRRVRTSQTDPKGALFRTIGRGTDELTTTPLPQANAYAMIRRRAASAGIETKIGNHTFRATGITAYLKNGGTLEKAAAMANHVSTRTTQLYDRRGDKITLDEVERVAI